MTAGDLLSTVGWHALRGDPLPWLLADDEPNLLWRVLVELFQRPGDSPAVVRARSGASAAEPVATLLDRLQPDGTWATRAPRWQPYSGPGWRLVAAIQWGADPEDPRLQAACGELLADAQGDGGMAAQIGVPPSPCITARTVQAVSAFGWGRHPRVGEALAWLEEEAPVAADGGWRCRCTAHGSSCAVTAVGLLGALQARVGARREALAGRAAQVLAARFARASGRSGGGVRGLGHPNLMVTDAAEVLAVLTDAAVPVGRLLPEALAGLQVLQDARGCWPRQRPVEASLPCGDDTPRTAHEPSRWVTLRALRAVLAGAVDAGLPRLFPEALEAPD